MKIVLSHALCDAGMDKLYQAPEAPAVFVARNHVLTDYQDQIREADGLIVRIGKCTAEVIEAAPNLKVIARTGVGYDNIDVAKATQLGIPVVITPGANVRSVAEHAVAMMMTLSKSLHACHTELTKGNWNIRNSMYSFELAGKLAGIVGMGAIGREVAKICQALGMRIAWYDPCIPASAMDSLGYVYYEDYHALLKDADVVTLHVPLLDSTRNMISAPEMAEMKPHSLLINCSRGGIVNEHDLCEALKNGVIGGAAADVFVAEPLPEDSELMTAPNLILTPHTAALSQEATVRVHEMCAEACLTVLRGERWPYVADPAVYQHPRWNP